MRWLRHVTLPYLMLMLIATVLTTGDVHGQTIFDQLQAGAREGLDRVLTPPADSRDDQKPFLGIVGDDDPRGVRILSVRTGGPAEAAGIQPGDVITSIQGRPVRNMDTLSAILQTKKPGQQLPVELLRGGRRVAIAVTLGTRSNPAPLLAAEPDAPPPEPEAETFPLPPPRNRAPSAAATPPPPLPGDQLSDDAAEPQPLTRPAPRTQPQTAGGGEPQPFRRPSPLLQRVGPLLDRVAPIIDEVVAPTGVAPASREVSSEVTTLRRQVTTLQAEVDALKRRLAELEARLDATP
jgi:hypothetical protein